MLTSRCTQYIQAGDRDIQQALGSGASAGPNLWHPLAISAGSAGARGLSGEAVRARRVQQ
jgi:hypothetical protein